MKLAAAVVLTAAFVLPAGCAAPPDPVAVVRLAVDRGNVPLGASLNVTIQFDAAPDVEPLNGDHRVFLQLLDGDGRMIWSSEHDPPVPTSAWRPGRSIQYTRRVRILPYPYLGPAVLAIGLQSADGTRLALAGDDLGAFTYRGAALTLEPRPESSFVVYEEGWHQVEFDVFNRTEWRWTTERAVLSFPNPRRAARLLLNVAGRADLFEVPPRLSLVMRERTLREVTLNTNEPVRIDHELTAADLGADDVARLELLVDRTFSPADLDGAAQDTRRLGVRVFDAYVEPLPDPRR